MRKESKRKADNKKSGKLRNDIIFVSALLAVIILAALGMLLFRSSGDTVAVTVDGKLFGEYTLNENRTVEIKTDRGFNLLVIKDGKAFVESASCPDGICSSHKPVSYDGESIICLPNKVVITVNSQDGSAPDIIS
jgi:hypothetical protein